MTTSLFDDKEQKFLASVPSYRGRRKLMTFRLSHIDPDEFNEIGTFDKEYELERLARLKDD